MLILIHEWYTLKENFMAKRIKLENKGDTIEVWEDQAQSLKEAGWKDPAEKKSKPKPKSFNTDEGEE